MIAQYMFHIFLGDNVSDDSPTRENVHGIRYFPTLNTTKETFREITQKARDFGFRSVLIEIADGLKYKSHPEIAVEGAWEVEELQEELRRLRDIGLTPYPKLNFSTAHDAWLGVYSRMVSTKTYYKVTREIIHEVIDLFEKPEFFHLGYDDENWESQIRYDYACYRQFDLYWNDYRFFIDTVKEKGVRPCVYADSYAIDKEKFLAHTPKDVIICPNYYNAFYEDASIKIPRSNGFLMKKLETYKELPALGYEILPSCTAYYKAFNIMHTIKYTHSQVDPDAVKAILVETLQPVIQRKKYAYLAAFFKANEAVKAL